MSLLTKIAIALALCILMAPGGATKSRAGDICSYKLPFASCGTNFQSFKTVIIGVHGWKGSCKSTFGEDSGSFFRLIDEDSFYDVDCFEYDSQHVPISELENQLRARLSSLHKMGYSHVMFVTHSLGGILVLRMLLDDILSADKTKFADASASGVFASGAIRVDAIYAWAIPIKGLTPLISGGAAAIDALADFSRATLPDLESGSKFLNKLSADLGTFCNLLAKASANDKRRFGVELHFYQGQRDDFVVENAASDDRLFKDHPGCIALTNTESGHSDNIGSSGTVAEFKYPLEVMEDKAQRLLPLSPRIEELFYFSAPSIPSSMVARQMRVIKGINAFSKNRFKDAYTASIALMRHVINDHFGRDADVDKVMIDNFVDGLKNQFQAVETTQKLVLVKLILGRVFGETDPSVFNSPDGFGKGNTAPIVAIVDAVKFMERAIYDDMQQDPAAAEDVNALDGIGPIDVAALKVEQQLLLGVQRDDVRDHALGAIGETASHSDPDSIKSAGLVAGLGKFALVNYSKLPPTTKGKIGQILLSLAQSDDRASRISVLVLLQKKVDWLNSSRPLWTAILNDQQAKALVDAVTGRDPKETSDGKYIEFMADVTARNGPSGNNSALALEVARKAKVAIENSDAKKRSTREDMLANAAQKSGYTSVVNAADFSQ